MASIRAAALTLLAEMPAPVIEPPPPLRFSARYEAAAVVSKFAIDPLRELDEQFRHNATELTDNEWALLPDVRLDVLRQVMSEGRLGELLRTQHRENDAVQRALSWAVDGIPAFENLDTASLIALVPLLPLFPNVDAREVTRRLELLRILEPFEHLVGDHFAGRRKELQQLRDYAGVADAFDIERRDPCLVVGPGGIGKSTLIAKFILDHARLAEQEKFPFAYIDFDRPVYDLNEPASILLEVVRQIGIQYAEAGAAAEGLREQWTGLFASGVRGQASRTARIVVDFRSFFETLTLRDKPLLLVLDTFEEIQYQSRTFVRRLAELLAQLSESIPRLRTVIAGRAEADDIRYADVIRLEQLDPEAATAFLRARGIEGKAALEMVKNLGGHPLTLHLAASLYPQEGVGLVPWLVPTNETIVRGLLYRRILAHVHDDDVRRLAHPGLLLRRITPEIIKDVLAEPAGLAIPTDAEAKRLFLELRCEAAIMTRESDEVLITRPDVRRIVLDFAEAEPEKARQVHSLAVAYYKTRSGEVARTEELYHRLMLDESAESLDQRFLEPFTRFLAEAMDELPPRAKTYLAEKLERDLPAEAWQAAEDVVWERAAARRVRERVHAGEFQDALNVLGERNVRSEHTALFLLETETLMALGRSAEAREVIARALLAYQPDSMQRAIVLNYSGMLRAEQDREGALQNLFEAVAIAKSHGDDLVLLNALLNIGFVSAPNLDPAIRQQIIETAFRVPLPTLKRDPRFFRRLITWLPPEVVQRLDPRADEELNLERRRGRGEDIDELRLDGMHQRAQAAEFLMSAIPTISMLREILAVRLDHSLESLTIAIDIKQATFDILAAAERQGWLGDLLAAARDLVNDERSLHLFDALGDEVHIEQSKSPRSLPVKEIRSYLERARTTLDKIQRQVCRVEDNEKLIATGWLVAPAIVFTSSANLKEKNIIDVRFDVHRIGNWTSPGITWHVPELFKTPFEATTLFVLDRNERWTTADQITPIPPSGECLWFWQDENGLHVAGVREVENVTEHHFTIPAATKRLAAGALCVDSSLRPIGMIVKTSSGRSSLAIRTSALASLLPDADRA